MFGIGVVELLIIGLVGTGAIVSLVLVVVFAAKRSSNPGVNPNLVPCADCGRLVSRQAVSCPQCGRPLGGAT
jgi:hypothetical protein